MSWPTKILPFIRPAHGAAAPRSPANPETFPRFHREWNLPPFPGRALVVGFGIPPEKTK
jgi:hypothetical protein